MKKTLMLLMLCFGLLIVGLSAGAGASPEWRCGACFGIDQFYFRVSEGKELQHRWASEVGKEYDASVPTYFLSFAKLKPAPKKDDCKLTDEERKSGIVCLGNIVIDPYELKEQYEIDFCLDHGETRIRRLK